MHSDVLSATPEDDASKERLVEELKSRAKVSVGQKNWPEAEALYTKAIEVNPAPGTSAAAALHGNRSMARFSMGNFAQALEDANEAVAADASYSKGFYRKGQACSKLNRFSEAVAAYTSGVALEPENKLFKKLLKKAEEDAANYTEPADEPPVASVGGARGPPSAPIESDADFRARMAATGGPVATGPMTAQARKKDASAKATPAAPRAQAADSEEEDEDLKGVNLRGYKKTSDGRTTSFFNNELDEKSKALIGDITPQAIKPTDAAAAAAPTAGGGSAWNSAGTFEAKNKTEWASAKLEEVLVGLEVSLPEGMGTVKVHALKDLTGDAEVTTMRNKKKYLFDFEFTLEWRGELKDIGSCKGTLKYPDVTPDCDGEYDVLYEVDKHTPPQARGVLDAFVRSSAQGLQPAITSRIGSFIEAYKAEF